ncbi:hypothetical protein GZH82_02130 [Staphylococcus ursi]|uniref:hypothetical protein n=1 Tax=Staphylococcus sp. MI 10-1553 TaxID=1912064 RepID=UPI00139843D2|nr:hypothetical protein [Staphylococcus sp. MI 10-1553]QHW36245.1 hypothetical protein GZH82_02130 [Staphylococcus sp. MI 10-1553]
MVISLAVFGFLFLFVLVIYVFKLESLIANIDFEQIHERYHDIVRRRWLIWTEMLVIVLGIWTTIFTFYYSNVLLYIGGIIFWVILTLVRLHYLTKKFKKSE